MRIGVVPARKNFTSMSIKFPPAILGLEMAAPILWAPGIFGLFLLETPGPISFLLLGGGGHGVLERGGGGESANFIFLGTYTGVLQERAPGAREK